MLRWYFLGKCGTYRSRCCCNVLLGFVFFSLFVSDDCVSVRLRLLFYPSHIFRDKIAKVFWQKIESGAQSVYCLHLNKSNNKWHFNAVVMFSLRSFCCVVFFAATLNRVICCIVFVFRAPNRTMYVSLWPTHTNVIARTYAARSTKVHIEYTSLLIDFTIYLCIPYNSIHSFLLYSLSIFPFVCILCSTTTTYCSFSDYYYLEL